MADNKELIKPKQDSTQRYLMRVNTLMDKAHQCAISNDIAGYKEFLEQLHIELIPHMDLEKNKKVEEYFKDLNDNVKKIKVPQSQSETATFNYTQNILFTSKKYLRKIHKLLNIVAHDGGLGLTYKKKNRRMS